MNHTNTAMLAMFMALGAVLVVGLIVIPAKHEAHASNTANTNTNATTNNNNSNAVLGSLFLTGEDRLTNFNRINETYTELSYAGNRTIMLPDTTTTATINATETGNLTFSLKPNGVSVVDGQKPSCD